jgi:hypothetical protein
MEGHSISQKYRLAASVNIRSNMLGSACNDRLSLSEFTQASRMCRKIDS